MAETSRQPQPITDSSEVLRRQIHPNDLDEEIGIISRAFVPGSNDNLQLSTLRGHVDAEECIQRHIAQGLDTAGTWGVQVEEAHTADLACLDDEHINGAPPDHASIDFTGLSKSARARAGRILRDESVRRRRLHPPSN